MADIQCFSTFEVFFSFIHSYNEIRKAFTRNKSFTRHFLKLMLFPSPARSLGGCEDVDGVTLTTLRSNNSTSASKVGANIYTK